VNILIIGAHRGIGAALAKQIEEENKHCLIKASRTYTHIKQCNTQTWTVHCDVTDEPSVQAMKQQLLTLFSNIDWLINCAGILHSAMYMPEKAIQQINSQQMTENFMTNAVGHLQVIKALKSMITSSPHAVVCSVSARIGSIDDNHLGGWYAYRMSKAALNMGLKSVAIEWARRHPRVKFLLLHPGTTDTDLSAPFQNNLVIGQLQSAQTTAHLLLKQIKSHQFHNSQHPLFLDQEGQMIKW